MVPAKYRPQKLPGSKGVASGPKSGRRQRSCRLIGILCLVVSIPWTAFAAAQEGELRGPDIIIIAEEERTIFEFRQGGELRMVRVVPQIGKPYYLVPRDQTRGFGNLERADMLVPSWVIVEF